MVQTLCETEWPSDKAEKKKKTAPGKPLTLRLPAPPGLQIHERHARALNENFVTWLEVWR